jgi:asparagine synthase (glutamine-hydrolysing)
LPEQILTRPKMGFPVPIDAWFRGPYANVLDDYVLSSRAIERGIFNADALRTLVNQHQRGVANHSERLWSLVNLEMWFRRFIDGEVASPKFESASEGVLARV